MDLGDLENYLHTQGPIIKLYHKMGFSNGSHGMDCIQFREDNAA